MCLGKLRVLGRKIQVQYESVISKRNLYGFSGLYMQAMNKLKKRDDGEAA
jgi:hypothetical protein